MQIIKKGGCLQMKRFVQRHFGRRTRLKMCQVGIRFDFKKKLKFLGYYI